MDEQFEAERILPSFLDACANRESTGNINLPDDCGNFLLPNFGKSSCSTSYAWSVGKDKYRELLVSAINDLASGRHGDFRQLTGFSARPSDVELLIASVRELQCLIFTRTLDWYECSVRHIDSPLDLLRLKMLSRHVDIYDSWYAPLHRIIGRLELYIPDDDANESIRSIRNLRVQIQLLELLLFAGCPFTNVGLSHLSAADRFQVFSISP